MQIKLKNAKARNDIKMLNVRLINERIKISDATLVVCVCVCVYVCVCVFVCVCVCVCVLCR